MKRYTTSGYRSVAAENMPAAAAMFAARMARKTYGKKGYARTCNETAHSQDGRYGEFSAFIGYSTGQHETTGNNINFSVSEL